MGEGAEVESGTEGGGGEGGGGEEQGGKGGRKARECSRSRVDIGINQCIASTLTLETAQTIQAMWRLLGVEGARGMELVRDLPVQHMDESESLVMGR